MKKIAAYTMFYFVQFTWGILQNALGFLLYLYEHRGVAELFHGAIITRRRGQGSVSLGIFIFLGKSVIEDSYGAKLKVHEYGHTIQSALLGPLYLPVIGLPSLIWNRAFMRKHRGALKANAPHYFDFWPERNANFLGKLVTKQSPPY